MIEHGGIGRQTVKAQAGRVDVERVQIGAEKIDPVAALAQRPPNPQEREQVAGRADRDQDEVHPPALVRLF